MKYFAIFIGILGILLLSFFLWDYEEPVYDDYVPPIIEDGNIENEGNEPDVEPDKPIVPDEPEIPTIDNYVTTDEELYIYEKDFISRIGNAYST